MDGKDRGHESTRQKLAGHPPQNKKQRNQRARVKQHIRQMVSPAAQAEQLAIQHVRERRQRIPLAKRPTRKGPADPCGGQARGDRRIVRDKAGVVVPQQAVVKRLSIDQPDRQQQKSTDGPREMPLGENDVCLGHVVKIQNSRGACRNRTPGFRSSSDDRSAAILFSQPTGPGSTPASVTSTTPSAIGG